MSFNLRDYQGDGVRKLRDAFLEGKRRPLFVLPTGGGKTAVFSFIAQSVSAKGRRAVILVHRQELLNQASRSLSRLKVPHGVISPKFSQTSDAVQVASVQTLVRRLDRVTPPDLIIIDEAHHATSKTYRDVIEAFPRAQVLGVTATPCRSDGQGLGLRSGGIFDKMILGPSMKWLMEEGFLTKAKIFAPPIGLDLTGIHKRGGDFDRRELAERTDKPTITGSAVEHYTRLCRGQPGIAFCVSVAHAEHVALEFRRSGINAARVDGAMDDNARRSAIEGLGSGGPDLLTSADLIGEGVDVPVCAVACLLRATDSKSLHLQQIGRALRPVYADGFDLSTREGRLAAIAAGPKPYAVILDHVGNTIRHGFPDDDFKWELDPDSEKDFRGKRKAETQTRIEQCPDCFFVYEAGPNACPGCGSEKAAKARKIREVEGELEELSREQAEIARRQARRAQGEAGTEEELIKLAKQRGYKNPAFWAKQILKGRKRA